MTTSTSLPRTRRRAPEWLVPAGLIALSLVPVAAGSARLTQLATSAGVNADNVRFFDAPVPIVAHIVGSTVFLVLGALQFAPSLRRRRWHRVTGRIVAPAGLVSALSALWMTVSYQMPAAVTGPGLAAVRMVLGVTMAAAIVAAFVAIRRGDVGTHSAWMTRAYAIGLGAGTQVVVFLPFTLLIGAPTPVGYTLLMTAGWVINLVVAEIVIRRRARTGARRTGARATAAPTGARLS